MTECERCRWYLNIMPLTTDELEHQRLMLKRGIMIAYDRRACILGGCDGRRFEEREDD